MIDRDIIHAKIGIIKRCMGRIQDVTRGNQAALDAVDVQDIFVLNLQRAVQGALDLAAHVVASEGLGMPQELREHFDLLESKKIIDPLLCGKMKKMVGFRNVAVHDYQTLSPEVLKSILKNSLGDLEEFYAAIARYSGVA